MQTRVTAILVARSGAAHLGRTLAAITRQSRPVDSIIAVDAGSSDTSAEILAASGVSQLISTSNSTDFGGAIAKALAVSAPAESDNDWIWLLGHDNAPQPDALAALLGAVEIAPSVGIAGPKLMRADDPQVIAEFGETMTEFGASYAMVEGELDQAQHDVQSDVLAMAASGMLVRRSLWATLGGFDAGLPSIDAALDFCIRARLAGFRVVGVPAARVASAGGPELFGRRSISDRRRAGIRRSAQLHRRLVYAPALGLPFHWLSLLPLAILRSIGQLLAKRPGTIGGELVSAIGAAFGATGIARARRNFRRTRRLGWSTIAPLRMPQRNVRERRAHHRETARTEGTVVSYEARAGFVSHGGLWVVVIAGVIGLIVTGPLLGATSLVGGTLQPLSGTVGELWANVGYGWREIGVGFVGAADPFSYVLAVLGTITFWSPSFSLVLVYVLALPLAALGAWFAARRLTARPYLPALAAFLWAVAPPLSSSLSGGHLGAVLAHLLLPWLVLAVLSAPRSWSASAAAALLFAAVTACAPILAPALVVGLLAWAAARPGSVHRLVGVLIPAAALFAPLIVQQLTRGTPFGLLAEPGVPVTGSSTTGLHLALLSAGGGLDGWAAVIHSFSGSTAVAVVVVAALLAPVGVLALLALFLPGSRRAVPSLVLAALGFATAVGASHLRVATIGADTAVIWTGAALSLFLLGLIGAVVVALDSLGRATLPISVLAVITATILAIPMLGAFYQVHGPAVVQSGSRALPAVIGAEADGHPQLGTLVLTPQRGGTLSATIQRGAGSTLDDQSTLAATSGRISSTERQVALLAGNLASRSGFDAAPELTRLSIGFVLLTPGDSDAAVQKRTSEALDSNPLFGSVGSSSFGMLWRYQDLSTEHAVTPVDNTGTPLGSAILLGQAIVFALTLLLGIPTTRRRRRRRVTGAVLTEPSGTFDEDDDD